jgi:hypothetical protein
MSNEYNRHLILNEIADPPGTFGLVQSVGKLCVNSSFTFVRILNVITEPIKITVYIDDIEVARDLVYKGVGYYLPVPKGKHVIRIYSDNNKNTTIIELNNVDIPTNQAVTIPVWKAKESLQIMILVDDVNQKIYPDKYVFRIVNLSPDNLSINISTPELNYHVSRSLDSGEYEGYFVRDPSKSLFEFTLPSQVGLRPVRATLNHLASRIYTEYIVGTIDLNTETYQKGYPLELVVSVDGNTIIRSCL